MAEERLQKILAQAGIASRRKAEQLMVEGRVAVNGEMVTALGTKADAERDEIKVDGTPIRMPKRHVYIALNKPREVVTTVSDPQGRATVMHLLKGVRERVFPVGRLDYHSEGLLLLTTDGEFANRITSPAGHVEKVYVVKANGHLGEQQLEDFRQGIPLHGRRTAPAHIKLIRQGDNPWYEVRLTEGRQNQIRIMFQHFHRLVEKLRRVKIGFLTLSGLEPGMWRYLEAQETERMLRMVQLEPPAPRPGEHVAGRRQSREEPPPRAARPERGPERPPRAPATERPHRAPEAERPPRASQHERRPSRKARTGRPDSARASSRGPESRKYSGPRPPSGKPSSRGPEPQKRSGPRPPSGQPPSRGPESRKYSGPRPPAGKPPSRRPASKKDRR